MAEGSHALFQLREVKRALHDSREYAGRLPGEYGMDQFLDDRATGGTKGSKSYWSTLKGKVEQNSNAIAEKEAEEMRLIRALSAIPTLEIIGREYIPCFKDLKHRGNWTGTLMISAELLQGVQQELFAELREMGFNVTHP